MPTPHELIDLHSEVLPVRLGILDTSEPDRDGRCSIIGVRIDGPGNIDTLAPGERLDVEWDGVGWAVTGTAWSRVGTWRLVGLRGGHLINVLPMEDETVAVTLVPGLRYAVEPIRVRTEYDGEVDRWELVRALESGSVSG